MPPSFRVFMRSKTYGISVLDVVPGDDIEVRGTQKARPGAQQVRLFVERQYLRADNGVARVSVNTFRMVGVSSPCTLTTFAIWITGSPRLGKVTAPLIHSISNDSTRSGASLFHCPSHG